MPVDTTSPPPCPVSPVKISPSAMSPPPLRRKFPCPTAPRADVLLGYPHELLSQVAVPGSLHVCKVRKGRLLFRRETLQILPISEHRPVLWTTEIVILIDKTGEAGLVQTLVSVLTDSLSAQGATAA
jgi:hypothetical protein